MEEFLELLSEQEPYNRGVEAIRQGKKDVLFSGLTGSAKAHVLWGLSENFHLPVLLVTESEAEAEKRALDLGFFGGGGAYYLPPRENLFYAAEVRSGELTAARLSVLEALWKGKVRFLTCSVQTAMQRLMPKEELLAEAVTLHPGDEQDPGDLARRLVMMGYERVDTVEGKGQFALRGGIMDIYPMTAETAYRIEWFDIEIDSLREMNVLTQLSSGEAEEISLFPAREVLLSEESRKALGEALQKEAENASGEQRERLLEDKEKLTDGRYFPSLDAYLPLIAPESGTVLSHFAEKPLLALDEPSALLSSAEASAEQFSEEVKTLLEENRCLPSAASLMAGFWESVSEEEAAHRVGLMAFLHAGGAFKPGEICAFSVKALTGYRGKMQFFLDDLALWREKKARIIIAGGSEKRKKRMTELLEKQGIPLQESVDGHAAPGTAFVAAGELSEGFEYPLTHTVVVSSREIFGSDPLSKRKRRKRIPEGKKIQHFVDLAKGDYVVHYQHGIGQYLGLETLSVGGMTRDYLKIRYGGADVLYIPADQLDLIQKYVGTDGKEPKVNKLGGTDWSKTKAKVRSSVAELADGLVKLYAARSQAKGYAFSPDTVWQQEFEAGFPYEETEDQLRSIEEVKRDMESDRPMDRLLCGDVGYGKTEVAIRAAFKAVMDGKQVAYLVPTTLLAQQIYNLFVQRMKDYPVEIGLLCRFRTPTQQKKTLEGVRKGQVDILIGTHRILSKDIVFKNFGLLIVDEEQRFGVAHKEALKKLKENVDVLTLTATPIPRTLHMSMVGIRDMSVLEEPPEERQPVETYVLEYNDAMIREGIKKELSRGGQVFYLFNRVQGIEACARRIQAMVPEAEIAVAHGKMSEEELENVMLRMVEGEVDVLVSTTIVENGIDIPNANTLIVEDADRLGLAQLYQIRGRVGRSRRRAYAYITYRKNKVLEEAAAKRLQAIRDFTEFGSGFKIAMRDLEIRGAGNLLGASQHGHMEAVGYDLYCRMLSDAVKLLNGEKVEEPEETRVELKTDAYLPKEYVPSQKERISLYKRINEIETGEDLSDMTDELIDRFGDMPKPAEALLDVAWIKALAKMNHISQVTVKGRELLFTLSPDHALSIDAVMGLSEKFPGRVHFTGKNKSTLAVKETPGAEDKRLSNIKLILQTLLELSKA